MQQHQEVEAYYKKRWKARLEDEEKSFSASVSFEAGGVVRECPRIGGDQGTKDGEFDTGERVSVLGEEATAKEDHHQPDRVNG